MGLLVDGNWQDKWYDTKSNNGKFIRSEAQFRNFITADGKPKKPNGKSFKAEKDRYHLYVSLACPWAHRVLIYRQLKKLQDFIPVSIVDYKMLENGWEFKADDNKLKDHLYNSAFLYQIYTRADPNYSGRVTVPILWDKKLQTIVSNESSEIIRMFNTAFDDLIFDNLVFDKHGTAKIDYYPLELRAEIDQLNQRIYSEINNGVYKTGFATSQSVYQENVSKLFKALDWLENILSTKRYLTGNQITEADWRLFPTLVRFDPVYVGHFKCNIKRIVDYPNLFGYVCDLYQQPKIAETVDMQHIKNHYYMSHPTVNPTGVVPVGPEINYALPHSRGKM